MKRILCIVLTAVLLFALVGCNTTQTVYSDDVGTSVVTTVSNTTTATATTEKTTTTVKNTTQKTTTTVKNTTQKTTKKTSQKSTTTPTTKYPPAKRQEFRIFVNGQDITEPHHTTYYVEGSYGFVYPVTAVIKACGGSVKWTSEKQGTIVLDQESYRVDLENWPWLVMRESDDTRALPMVLRGGTGTAVYYVEHEELMMSGWIASTLYAFGISPNTTRIQNDRLDFIYQKTDGSFRISGYKKEIAEFTRQTVYMSTVENASTAVDKAMHSWEEHFSEYRKNPDAYMYNGDMTVLYDKEEDAWLVQGVVKPGSKSKLPTCVFRNEEDKATIWWADTKITP